MFFFFALPVPAYDADSPSKASSGRTGAAEGLQPLGARRLAGGGSRAAGTRDISRRSFSGFGSARSSKVGGGNATFLTECSFGVAHDRLVQVITDVQPFEPYWDQLSAIDLSNKGLESVARLKEFLPRLDSLTLCVVHLHCMEPGKRRPAAADSDIFDHPGTPTKSHG